MNSSFYNGISGIKTQQFGIDVWSNNIANIDTVGFKNSHPEFATIFSTTLGDQYFNPTSNDIGLGSRAQATSLDLREGFLKTTDNTFDLALSDKGWFGLKGADNKTYYTRAGSFKVDKNRDLVNDDGLYVLGTNFKNTIPFTGSNDILNKFGMLYKTDKIKQANIYSIKNNPDTSNNSVNTQTKITLPNNLYHPAVATTNVKISANLNPHVEFDSLGNEIPNKEHFSTSVISTNGDKKLLDITFIKKIDQPNHENIWDGKIQLLSFYENYDKNKIYNLTQYKINKSINKVYKIEEEKNAQVQFTTIGSLQSVTMPKITNDGVDISINIGDIGKYNGFTSMDISNGIKNISSNGKEDGMLTKYGVDSNGNIIANFSNGENTSIAKIAVYHFKNDQGLNKTSETLLTQSENSGKAFFYKDQNGNLFDTTSILSNRLEVSNTQISTALTELIVMQKAFDASAKSITTSDQMIQNAINMKK